MNIPGTHLPTPGQNEILYELHQISDTAQDAG